QYEWVPTGELSLQLEADTEYGTRKNWADTKTKKLESRLADVVDGLTLIAISIKAMRAKREDESRQSLIREARRLERARHEECQRRLRHMLVKNSENWQRAQELRAFIQATCLHRVHYFTVEGTAKGLEALNAGRKAGYDQVHRFFSSELYTAMEEKAG
nr:hypothetical protein [Tanacetum cinerariifolium]